MDEVEKSALFYYLYSIAASLSILTQHEEYSKETLKTGKTILDTLLNKFDKEL